MAILAIATGNRPTTRFAAAHMALRLIASLLAVTPMAAWADPDESLLATYTQNGGRQVDFE